MLDNQEHKDQQLELANLLSQADEAQQQVGMAAIMGFLVGLGVKRATATG